MTSLSQPAARHRRTESLLTPAARAGLRSDGFRWAIAPALAAWVLLALWAGTGRGLEFCFGVGTSALAAAGSAIRAEFALADPGSIATEWLLMTLAMMLPLALPAIAHVAARSFFRRRERALAIFVSGFALVWFAAGVLAIPLLLLSDAVLDSAGLGRWGGIIGCALAALWQVSPAKGLALRRCHLRPSLPAVGPAADLGALAFGVGHGLRCLRSCFAMMVPPLLGGQHLMAMAVVTLLLFAERATDRPAFGSSALVLLLLGVAMSAA